MSDILLTRPLRVMAALLLTTFGLFPAFVAGTVHADDTWRTAPATNDYNTGSNWVGNTVPTGGATAIFGASNTTALTVNANISPGAFQFNAGAPAYTFTVSPSTELQLTGAGIVNNSSNAATIATTASTLKVLGSASLGNAQVSLGRDSALAFIDNASGGTATVGSLLATIDLSNLTSSGTTLAAISGNGWVVLGSKELSVSDNNGPQLSYDGNISGTGSLRKTGTGTLRLFGSNSYSGGTTITAGALEGDTSSIRGDIVNNGSVALFQSVRSSTYAGTMSGTGSLSIANGTVALTGTNSYSGGTRIYSNAAVVVSSDANLGAVSGRLTLDDGTLVVLADFSSSRAITIGNGTIFIDGFTFVQNGVIDGPGRLSKDGGGTLILTGVNTYAGGTTVAAGTLIGTTDSLQGNITNNSRAIFDQTGSGAYSGIMSGSGSLVKTGTGTVVLAAANTFSGGTTIDGGTLQIDSTSLRGTITNNANLIINENTNATFTQRITGTGGVTKTGAGTLILASTGNNYTGGTTVSAGVLRGSVLTLQGNIVNNAAVVFDNGTSFGNYLGDVSGVGSLTVAGGFLSLLGTNSYTGGTIISNGTGLSGNTRSLQGPITNNGFLVFEQASDGTYSGAISGSGSVSITNTGTVTLAADNTYTGGTSISGGTVAASSDRNFGDAAGGLHFGGGTLKYLASFDSSRSITLGSQSVFPPAAKSGGTFDTNGHNSTLSGVISGDKGLTKTGAGTLTLNGINTYTGGTLVSGGTLLGSSLSLQGNIANNAAVVFSQTTTGTYAGIMSGTGSLTLQGNGLLNLAGLNTYSGGTVVTGGTLQGTSSSLQGSIANNAVVVFNQSSTGTYAGEMSGTGSLTLQGGGVLNLTGTNTYTGATNVNGSALVVNGSLASSVIMNGSSLLAGSGTIGGLTNNGGIVAPGNSIGTLTVTGNFVQNGGVFIVEANSAGQSDRVSVGGRATINGGTVQVVAQSGTYARNTNYTIMSAAGGLTGTYSGVTSNFAFLTPTLSYDANNIYLLLAQSSSAFASGAQTPNQYAVGSALDQANTSATGDFGTVLSALSALNTAQGPAALNAISGQNYSGFSSAMVLTAQLFMNNFLLQAGSGSGRRTRVALAEACNVACDAAPSALWGAWGGALGGTGSFTGNANSGSFTYNVGGVAAGLDRRLTPNLLAGLTIGYTTGMEWIGGFSGQGVSNTFQAGLYGSYVDGPLHVDGVAAYAYSANQMWRNIVIPGLAPRTAQGLTGANQFYGQVETGYRFDLGGGADTFVTPFARLQAYTGTQNAFTETGAQSLNLNIAAQTTNSLRSVLGAQIGGALDLGWREKLVGQLRIGWSHEFADTARPVSATFTGAPTVPFTTYGVSPQRDGVVVGVSLNTAIAESALIYLRYEGDISGQDNTHALTAGLRMTW